jgi:histidinol dehydrogenase
MIKVYKEPKKKDWPSLLARPQFDAAPLKSKVREMMEAVKAKGDIALAEYTLAFDKVAIANFKLSPAVIEAAEKELTPGLKTAIQLAKVNKIFGPGNQYVTAAKQLIQQEGVAIDMPAGPSEVCVWADETCIPSFVAADLLSQAEHGADSQVILIANKIEVVELIQKEIEQQIILLPRKEMALKALMNSKAIIIENTDDAITMVNKYAPEHLSLSIDNAAQIAEKIINAGSIFIGNFSPESVGDYASGTNHTLPTNGFAKAYSGVSMDSFVKKITFQQLTERGLTNIASTVIEMATAEGLQAHSKAVELRVEWIKSKM